MINPSTLNQRAIEYATARRVELKLSLGFGKDGSVFSTTSGRAVKVFANETAYQRELECYHRFAHAATRSILGHHVPQLLSWDDTLLIIEMTIVQPPFLLDFASAYLDYGPDFPPEVLDQWELERHEMFGPHWSHVKVMLDLLERDFCVYLYDVHPANITFDSDDAATP